MSRVDELITPTPGAFLITIFVYFLILAVIGYVAAKQTRNMREFLIMGGKADAIVSGIAYFATQYSMDGKFPVDPVSRNSDADHTKSHDST